MFTVLRLSYKINIKKALTGFYNFINFYLRYLLKEYAILEYMCMNSGAVLSREIIENHIWNYDYTGGSNVVDVYISYLRKKIDGNHKKKLIHTI